MPNTFPQGKFISIDGSEGTGKSTQIANICQYLRAQGKTVYATREPGGTAIGEKIRAIFLDPALKPSTLTELLLVFAARRQHLDSEIFPRLARGEWVISDRFNDSTYAYQGAGRGIDPALIRQLEILIQGEFQPDLSLILTLDINNANQRLAKRNQAPDRLEQENNDFFTRIHTGYQQRAQHCAHVHLIDGSGSPEEVFTRISTHLQALCQA